MVTRKEDTASRVARWKYEEKNKELCKEKNANFQTMIRDGCSKKSTPF